MKKIVLVFAIVGVFYTINDIYKYIIEYQTIHKYYNDCEKIKVGMTLQEVRKIIGDERLQYSNKCNIRGDIFVSIDSEDSVIFSLVYPYYKLAQSESMRFDFDPNTLKITKIYCNTGPATK